MFENNKTFELFKNETNLITLIYTWFWIKLAYTIQFIFRGRGEFKLIYRKYRGDFFTTLITLLNLLLAFICLYKNCFSIKKIGETFFDFFDFYRIIILTTFLCFKYTFFWTLTKMFYVVQTAKKACGFCHSCRNVNVYLVLLFLIVLKNKKWNNFSSIRHFFDHY